MICKCCKFEVSRLITKEEIGWAAACTHKGGRSGDIIWDIDSKRDGARADYTQR
jgi:hypothetical protein